MDKINNIYSPFTDAKNNDIYATFMTTRHHGMEVKCHDKEYKKN